MAQESSGLRVDDERPEVRNNIRDDDDDRLAVTATASEIDAETADDNLLLGDETTDETEQIREQIEETRSSMGETIDAIQERLSFSNISEQVSEQVSNAIETAKDTVYDATIGKAVNFMKQTGNTISKTGFGRTISANPIPYALIGVGSAWLIYNTFNSGRRKYGNGSRYRVKPYLAPQRSEGEASTGTLSGTTEKLSNTANKAYERVTSTAGSAYETVATTANDTYQRATDVANRAYEKAGEYGHLAQEKYEHYIDEKPLAVAAAAAAVGAAIGLAIPSSTYEARLMGETRDNLMSTAGDAAGELVDKAKQVAGEAGKAIKDEIAGATEAALPPNRPTAVG